MSFIEVKQVDKSVEVSFARSPVNALNLPLLIELHNFLDNIPATTNLIIFSGGNSKFFSFGLDIPELLEKSRNEVKEIIISLLDLCKKIYLLDQITIAKINGHATGGGCMIALSTDFRFMINNKSKIALNEINIGLSLFESTIEILKEVVGNKNAKEILLGGKLLNVDQAINLSLVDTKYDDENFFSYIIEDFSKKDLNIIKDMKDKIRSKNKSTLIDKDDSIEKFLDIFYINETQEKLKKIKIKK